MSDIVVILRVIVVTMCDIVVTMCVIVVIMCVIVVTMCDIVVILRVIVMINITLFTGVRMSNFTTSDSKQQKLKVIRDTNAMNHSGY